jgi:pilus assembly protein CpaE
MVSKDQFVNSSVTLGRGVSQMPELPHQSAKLDAPPAAAADKAHSTTKDDSHRPVFGVLGAKGGVGTTTIAINLTVALSKTVGRTTLLDANLQQPHAALVLGQEPKHTILDLLDRSGECDDAIFEACCTPVTGAGASPTLLTPPLDGDAGVRVTLSQVAECLDNIRRHSKYWVIDLPTHLDRHLVTLMDRCDVVLLILEPTLASAMSAGRWLRVFQDLGYPPQKLLTVVNRSGGKFKDVENQLRQHIDYENTYKLPNAYEILEKACTHGEPVVVMNPKAAYSMAMTGLASSLRERF